MPVYTGCSEDLAAHVCNPCPDASEREFGRVRTAGFIFSDFLPTLIAAPTLLATWLTGISTGKIIVVPETAGDYDPGDPKELKGYGDRPSSNGPRTMTLKFNDPNLADNYAHYNGLNNQTELVPFFRTSSKLRIFDKAASIIAKDPVADDLESEVTWEVTAKVISSNIPTYHDASALLNTVFKCSYLNDIEIVAPSYDTELTFVESASADSDGVSAVAGATDAQLAFSFDAITPQIGTPATMNLNLDDELVLVVDFPTDYTGEPWSFTDADGTVHTGVFTNGDVDL